MRELDIYRRQQRRLAQRSAGIHPGSNVSTNVDLMTADEVRNAHAHADVLTLPNDFARLSTSIQGPGGGWGFMVGISSVGGSDPVI